MQLSDESGDLHVILGARLHAILSDRHLGEGSCSNACNLVGIDCNRLQSILHAVADIAPTDSNAPASFWEMCAVALIEAPTGWHGI